MLEKGYERDLKYQLRFIQTSTPKDSYAILVNVMGVMLSPIGTITMLIRLNKPKQLSLCSYDTDSMAPTFFDLQRTALETYVDDLSVCDSNP